MKNVLFIFVCVCAFIIGMFYVRDLKTNINYADFPCPICDSLEVLNFGENDMKNEIHMHCPDCDYDFYILTDK